MNSAGQWEALRLLLQQEKNAVVAEIEAYPRPIAGCDAQFNHLLERRRLLWEELARLEAARGKPPAGAADFLRSSPCLDSESKQAILEALDKPAVGSLP
jgi:chorismate mutase